MVKDPVTPDDRVRRPGHQPLDETEGAIKLPGTWVLPGARLQVATLAARLGITEAAVRRQALLAGLRAMEREGISK